MKTFKKIILWVFIAGGALKLIWDLQDAPGYITLLFTALVYFGWQLYEATKRIDALSSRLAELIHDVNAMPRPPTRRGEDPHLRELRETMARRPSGADDSDAPS